MMRQIQIGVVVALAVGAIYWLVTRSAARLGDAVLHSRAMADGGRESMSLIPATLSESLTRGRVNPASLGPGVIIPTRRRFDGA